MDSDIQFKSKYLKYKSKYIELKNSLDLNMTGGGDKIDIMLFKADWCGHCKSFKSTWTQLENQYNKKFNFITYDNDQHKDIVKEMKVTGFQTIMFKDGKEVQEYNGSREYEVLDNILSNLVKIE